MIYIYDKGKVNEATPLPELFQTLRARSEEMCDYIMDVDNYAMPGAMPQQARLTVQNPVDHVQSGRKRQVDQTDNISMQSLAGNKRIRPDDYVTKSNEFGSWDDMSHTEDDTIVCVRDPKKAVAAETGPAYDLKRLLAEVNNLDNLVAKERSQKHILQNQRDALIQKNRELQTENQLHQTHLREAQAELERLRGERSEVVLLTPQPTKTDEEHFRSFASLNQKVKDLAQHLNKAYPPLAAEATPGLRRRDYVQGWLSEMLYTVVFSKYLAAVQRNVCTIVTDLASEVPVQHRNIWKAMTAKALNAQNPLENRKRSAVINAGQILAPHYKTLPIETCANIEQIVITAVELQWDIAREGKDIRVMWARPGDTFDLNWMEDVRATSEIDEMDHIGLGVSWKPPRPVDMCIAFGVQTPASVPLKSLVSLGV